MIKNVAFFGYADAQPESELYVAAFDTAKLLAGHGFTVVNGGGPGVMDASTKGAEEAGGNTLAVTFSPKDAPGFEGRYVKNIVDREIKTHNYIERMFTLMEHGDIYIMFKGGTGTISEFGTAWVLARLYYGHHKPFILYGDFWHEVMACLKKHMVMRGTEDKVYTIVNSSEAVLEAIGKFDREISGIDHSKHCKVCEDLAFMS